jgi:hypothetical protein
MFATEKRGAGFACSTMFFYFPGILFKLKKNERNENIIEL